MRSETGEKNSRGSLVSGVFAGGRGQLRGRKNADTRLISVAGTCAPRFSVIRLGAVSGVIRDYHISPITLPTVAHDLCGTHSSAIYSSQRTPSRWNKPSIHSSIPR